VKNQGFELLAAVLPLSDRPGCLFALDRPPETAGLLGVPAFCGDDGELGRGKHCAPTVTEAQGELEAAERMTFGGIEISAEELPDYRLTCIFVDRDYRRKGVAGVALRGALELIAEAGGGVVEGYPQDTQGKKISAKFLYNTTRSLYEQTGFTYVRPKGKNHCVMRRTVSPA
jgi:GNAT superfamily N-acetyltransferase